MTKATFIPAMLLLRREKLPEGPDWRYELKHDGYRAIAFKSDRTLYLRSRNNSDFAHRYPKLLKGSEPDQGEVQTHEVLEDDVSEEYTDED